MKLQDIAVGMAVIAALLCPNSVLAQADHNGLGKLLPVEWYECSYDNDKNSADLDKAINRWTNFMDEKNIDDYAAWVMIPYYYNASQDFDFVWMGAYIDGNAMGVRTDSLFAGDGDLQQAFDGVVSCDSHSMLASAMYKSFAEIEAPATVIFTISNCTLNEGYRYSDIKKAELEWAEYLVNNNSSTSYFHWFPIFGGGDADFDYKVVYAYSNFTELGADVELWANGGGRESSQGIFNEIQACDDARVYIATTRRDAPLR